MVAIHPSSAIFHRQPEWVVFHEVVQTTKEYMREVIFEALKANGLHRLLCPFFFGTNQTSQKKKKCYCQGEISLLNFYLKKAGKLHRIIVIIWEKFHCWTSPRWRPSIQSGWSSLRPPSSASPTQPSSASSSRLRDAHILWNYSLCFIVFGFWYWIVTSSCLLVKTFDLNKNKNKILKYLIFLNNQGGYFFYFFVQPFNTL